MASRGIYPREFSGALDLTVHPAVCVGPTEKQDFHPPTPAPRGQHRAWVPYHGCLLLKLLDGPLVDPPTLVDEMPGGGGLARVHVADDNDIDMGLLFAGGGGFLPSVTARGEHGVGEATAFQACLSPLLPSTLLLSSTPLPTSQPGPAPGTW